MCLCEQLEITVFFLVEVNVICMYFGWIGLDRCFILWSISSWLGFEIGSCYDLKCVWIRCKLNFMQLNRCVCVFVPLHKCIYQNKTNNEQQQKKLIAVINESFDVLYSIVTSCPIRNWIVSAGFLAISFFLLVFVFEIKIKIKLK